MSEQLIDAMQVAALCGRKSMCFVWDRLKSDPTFPRPSATRKHSVGGKTVRLWRKSDIAAWADAETAKKMGRPTKDSKLAIDLIVQFVSGRFDSPEAKQDRQCRIEQARNNGIKNQPKIRIQGVWL